MPCCNLRSPCLSNKSSYRGRTHGGLPCARVSVAHRADAQCIPRSAPLTGAVRGVRKTSFLHRDAPAPTWLLICGMGISSLGR